MAIDWNKVGLDALNAAKAVVGAQWKNIAAPAAAQIGALISVGKHIESECEAGKLTQDEFATLKSMQKNALEGIIAAHQGISIVVAEQAAAAAVNVVVTALSGMAGFAFV